MVSQDNGILTKLAKIAALNVISRTSVMQYRVQSKHVRQIGDALRGFARAKRQRPQ